MDDLTAMYTVKTVDDKLKVGTKYTFLLSPSRHWRAVAWLIPSVGRTVISRLVIDDNQALSFKLQVPSVDRLVSWPGC